MLAFAAGADLASMGPGSFDPGNAASSARPLPRSPLQWGRGLLTPEISLADLRIGGEREASMGPGSFDPGNAKASFGAARTAMSFNGAGVF